MKKLRAQRTHARVATQQEQGSRTPSRGVSIPTDLVRRRLDPVEGQVLVKRLCPGLGKALGHAVHVIVIRSLIGICKCK